MTDGQSFLDLFDFRLRVLEMYRRRRQALLERQDPAVTLALFRAERDDLFAHHPQSALSESQRSDFSGLRYFDYNPAACVEAIVTLETDTVRSLVETSGEEAMPMAHVATLAFDLEGNPGSLALYWIEVYGGGLFLPFRDATAATETYGGGRYLFDTVKGSDFAWAQRDDRTRMILDFNMAYNPSCAYDHRWACPLAPPANRLAFPIRAGEMKYAA